MVIKLKFLKRTHLKFFPRCRAFCQNSAWIRLPVCVFAPEDVHFECLSSSDFSGWGTAVFVFFSFFLCRWGLWIGIFSSSASTRSLARPQTDTQRQTPCSLCYSDQITMASTRFPMRTLKNTPSSCRFSHLSQLRCVEFKASRTESSFIETQMHEPRRLHVVSVLLWCSAIKKTT